MSGLSEREVRDLLYGERVRVVAAPILPPKPKAAKA